MAAHGHAEPSKAQVNDTINTIEELEKYLNSLDLEPIREKAKAHQEKLEAERQEHLKEREEHERMLRKLDLGNEND